MKNVIKLIGFIALATVIGFSITACGDGGGGTSQQQSKPPAPDPQAAVYRSVDGDGNTYRLEITENVSGSRAAYAAKTGDTYILTIVYVNGTTKTSSGTVSSVSGNFTLKPAGAATTFTVTVIVEEGTTAITGTITAITGTVTFEDKKTEEVNKTNLKIDPVTEMDKWLAKQPANTPATAYKYDLKVIDFGGYAGIKGSVGYVLRNSDKYVYLDLSGSSLKSITGGAFCTDEGLGCATLTGITIPNSVTSIGDHAFGYCTSLTSITIPNGVTIIRNGTFGYCTSLTSITIPDSVTSMGDWTFQGTKLASVTIPNSVTSIGIGVFYECTSLASVNIGNGVTSIGNVAFNQCPFTSVTIPNGVTTIGNMAFVWGALTSVTIPASVTRIEGGAFQIDNLTSVTFQSASTELVGDWSPFPTDLRDRYREGGIGTYTRVKPSSDNEWPNWTKQ
jgi:hypothetical protein